MQTWGSRYWPVWLAVVLISFLGPEIYALVTNVSNTLSDWVWGELKIVPRESIGQWSAVDLLVCCAYVAVFCVWLPWHFFGRDFT
jgi:hypothetical protein